jgi:hypothetical protein
MLENDKRTFATQLDDYNNYLNENKEFEDKKNARKFVFNTETLTMLGYKTSQKENVVEKKDENIEIDILKLSKYLKPKKEEEKVTNISTDHIKSLKTVKEDNQAQVVKNEILSSFNIEKNIETKRQNLNKLLKDSELPDLEEYDNFINRRSFHEQVDDLPNFELFSKVNIILF